MNEQFWQAMHDASFGADDATKAAAKQVLSDASVKWRSA